MSTISDKTLNQAYCLGFNKLTDQKYNNIYVFKKSGVFDNSQAMMFVMPDKNTVIAILLTDKDYNSWFDKNCKLIFDVLDKVIGVVNENEN